MVSQPGQLHGGVEDWLEAGCLLKVETPGLAKALGMGQRERGAEED